MNSEVSNNISSTPPPTPISEVVSMRRNVLFWVVWMLNLSLIFPVLIVLTEVFEPSGLGGFLTSVLLIFIVPYLIWLFISLVLWFRKKRRAALITANIQLILTLVLYSVGAYFWFSITN